MEQNLPIIAKKIWKIVRVIYFMLRKGISKVKLLSALNVMMKRGKLAGKEAIQNLIFHHAATATAAAAGRDYEYTCRDSPAGFHLIAASWRKNYYSAPPCTPPLTQEDLVASPALPGFGPSRAVRQLRITDSPFPVRDFEDKDDQVDEAAEEFIIKFYKDLRLQN